jgi:hypothetical protein
MYLKNKTKNNQTSNCLSSFVRIMYYGLKKAFPDLTVVSEERESQDPDVPMPVLDNKVNLPPPPPTPSRHFSDEGHSCLPCWE